MGTNNILAAGRAHEFYHVMDVEVTIWHKNSPLVPTIATSSL